MTQHARALRAAHAKYRAVSFAAQACVAGVVCMRAATHGVSYVGAQVASQAAPHVALFVRVVGLGNTCLDLVQINQGFHNKSKALGPKAAHSPPESLFDWPGGAGGPTKIQTPIDQPGGGGGLIYQRTRLCLYAYIYIYIYIYVDIYTYVYIDRET